MTPFAYRTTTCRAGNLELRHKRKCIKWKKQSPSNHKLNLCNKTLKYSQHKSASNRDSAGRVQTVKKRSHSVQSAGIEEKSVHLCVSDKSYFTVSCIKNRRMKVQSSAGQLTVSKQAAAAAARTSSQMCLKPTVRSCSCCNGSSSSYWTLEDPFLMYSKVQMKTKFSQCDS